MLNVFNREFGTLQGRIPKADAPDGSFVYEIGHASMRDALVNPGDYHEVTQTFLKSSGSLFILATIVIRVPPVLPIASTWTLSAALNSVVLISRRLRLSKRAITLDDWKISLADANAAPTTNTLKFRLELD